MVEVIREWIQCHTIVRIRGSCLCMLFKRRRVVKRTCIDEEPSMHVIVIREWWECSMYGFEVKREFRLLVGEEGCSAVRKEGL